MENLSINHWAMEDRPREKMMTKGVEALSDAELLAICKRVLDECGTTVTVVECKCECKKLPWYKRFWNWIRRK